MCPCEESTNAASLSSLTGVLFGQHPSTGAAKWSRCGGLPAGAHLTYRFEMLRFR